MISRRKFFKKLTQTLGTSFVIPSVVQSCNAPPTINGKILGANASLGHRLRTMNFAPPTKTISTKILIIGGGVSGLSAARYLKKFTNDFLLVEMDDQPGGNSRAGYNDISPYPWGAHYLPIPGTNDADLIDFLTEAGVITGSKDGEPTFNEYYLCHDPKERLYINHFWQEGLIPHEGVPAKDRLEIERFLALMAEYKHQKGNDGLDAFTIPIAHCSADKNITDLDRLSAKQFLEQHKFESAYVMWYVGYCCADDYGSSLNDTSAWAMVHYFASRRGGGKNTSSDAVLTWPEGNYWLVNQLKKPVERHIQPNSLAYRVTLRDDHRVEVLIFDALKNVSTNIVCQSVIMATPQYVNQRLLASISRNIDYTQFQYAPWMVANITTNASLDGNKGEHLSWDNVIYGSNALGYVNAMHQQVGFHGNKRVITYYKPLPGGAPADMRKEAYAKTFEQWKLEILNDLKIPHKNIEKYIEEMNVWLWGHGMIKPLPGFISSKNRADACLPLHDKIFFAHSDLSGISIFEEAFYWGHKCARAVLRHGKL